MFSFTYTHALQQAASSLEFFILIIAITVSLFLAIVVYREKRQSATNRIFFLLSVFTALWLISSYSIKLPLFVDVQLLLTRLAIFFAAPMSALFFLMAHTFPSDTIRLKKETLYLTIIATFGMMVLNISPYAITRVVVDDGVANPVAGIGIIPFSLISTLFSVLAVYFLLKKGVGVKTKEKRQVRLVLIGVLAMLVLVIGTVLVPLLLFSSGAFLPFMPAYALLFLGMTAYAIVKYHLFDIKVLVTQALTLVLWVILFARIVGSESASESIVNAVVFTSVVLFGVFLVRSVKQEVSQREKIERLARELARANERLKELDQRKSEFVSLASHQLRSPLTAIKGYASMLLEGSFGGLSDTVKDAVDKIFESSNRLVAIIEDFLTISRIEQNRLAYNFTRLDFKELVEKIIQDMRPSIEKRGLALSFDFAVDKQYMINADSGKIVQVVNNLIDNAMKYTPKGSIVVKLAEDKNFIKLSIADTGVGMSKETREKIFSKFSRADNAHEMNVSGTGLGLFVAKQLVEAHKGRIWAESEGEGKGSTFYVEFSTG